MEAIKSLAMSHGFYGRLYRTLKENPEALEFLEKQNFKDSFIYKVEASIFLDTVKKLHLEEAYMTWRNDHFKDTVPAKSTIE